MPLSLLCKRRSRSRMLSLVSHCLSPLANSYPCLFQNHYLKDVPFHNSIHAADVTQTSHVLLSAQPFEVSAR